MANNLSDFLKLAQESKVQLRFDACVGGGIPICQILLNSSPENHIKKIYGIINATTNFILTAMEEHQWSFEQALTVAKQNGCSLERRGIRQLFYIEEKAGLISYYVGPFDVSKLPAVKHVSGIQNCIMVDYENSGLRSFYGNGAGGKETASVMIEDLLDLLSRKRWFVLEGQVRGERLDYEDMVERSPEIIPSI